MNGARTASASSSSAPTAVQHGLGPHRQPLPGRGEQHLARRTLEQLHAEGLLQRGDGAGERGLAHADRGGGVPEVQMLGDGRERPQLGQARLRARALAPVRP